MTVTLSATMRLFLKPDRIGASVHIRTNVSHCGGLGIQTGGRAKTCTLVLSAVVNIQSSGASITSEPTASRANSAALPSRLSRWAPVRGRAVGGACVGGFIRVVAMAASPSLPQSMLKLLRRLRRNWIKVMTKTSTPSTIDIAVAYPICWYLNALRTMYQTMEAELNSGPPAGVMMLISVKIWDPAMMLVTTRKKVTGRTI